MLHIRQAADGTYWIPRRDQETEDYLNSKYQKLPGELKWISRLPSTNLAYRNLYTNAHAYIIGKGPSLDLLTPSMLAAKEGPIIAINESIHRIEALHPTAQVYGVQMDHDLRETCAPTGPNSRLILSPRCGNLYESHRIYKDVIDPRSFGLLDNCLSAVFAIQLARHMGCVEATLCCFDGCTVGDFEYAKCIGHSSELGGPKTRFKSHRLTIQESAGKFPLTWFIPPDRYTNSLF